MNDAKHAKNAKQIRDMFRRKPDPTPEEIRRACLRIRAGWDKRLEKKRRSREFGAIEWTVPIIPVADIEAMFGVNLPDDGGLE